MSPGHGTRQRTARSRQAILSAAFELAMQMGYAKLTMEGVAARAGVGKQTIYRWWPSKAALVLDVLTDRVGEGLDFPDTGDIAADMVNQVAAAAKAFDSELGGLYRGVIADAQSDAHVAASIRETYLAPRIGACADRLTRAVAAGQLRDDIPVHAMIEMLYGPLYYRTLLGIGPRTAEHAAAVTRSIIDGLSPR